MKKLIEKLKEKWFWFRNPNFNYQIETHEEKEMWLDYFTNGNWQKAFTQEERDNAITYLKNSFKEDNKDEN